MKRIKVLYLDLDGTIRKCQEDGIGFVNKVSDVKVYDRVDNLGKKIIGNDRLSSLYIYLSALKRDGLNFSEGTVLIMNAFLDDLAELIKPPKK